MTHPPLILGSTSRYRRELLARLRIPFDVEAPRTDETPLASETPAQLASRLALQKARDVAERFPDAVVIGSDQVADLDGAPIGKPGSHERAVGQLRLMSGRSVIFQTAVAVVRPSIAFSACELVPVHVRFRVLSDAEIERYLRLEQPYDCAGSAKSETLGIALLDAIESDDPTALVGLPLIRTCRLLRQAGLDPMLAADESRGSLYLMPNTLDFGMAAHAAVDLQQVLPLGVIRTAARLEYWIAENAKTARAFLKRVDQVAPLLQPLQAIHIVELPRPNKGQKQPDAERGDLDELLAPALQGHDIGLISEAGLPAVADPGAEVVRAAHKLQLTVLPLSGPSSLLLALAASGLNGQSFAFVGYLPVDPTQRSSRIRDLETQSRRAKQTQLIIETPYRNQHLLDALLASLNPTTTLAISCGLTLDQGWSRTDSVGSWKGASVTIAKDMPAVFALLAT